MPVTNDWDRMTAAQWRSFIRDLAAVLPIGRYTVRRERLSGCFGSIRRRAGVWWIRIADRLEFDAAVYALLEEWAHAMSWPRSGPDHTDHWGVNYAKCIRAFEKIDQESQLF